MLVRHANITSGHWGIYIRFALGATNIGPDKNNLMPAAIVPVAEIGISQFAEPSNLTVDASQVNPQRSKVTRKRRKVEQ